MIKWYKRLALSSSKITIWESGRFCSAGLMIDITGWWRWYKGRENENISIYVVFGWSGCVSIRRINIHNVEEHNSISNPYDWHWTSSSPESIVMLASDWSRASHVTRILGSHWSALWCHCEEQENNKRVKGVFPWQQLPTQWRQVTKQSSSNCD